MSDNAFIELQKLSKKFIDKSKALPVETETAVTRSYVYFSVLKQKVVIAVEEMSEVLELQTCTRLPSVKRWVKGLANVRGRLLPVIDFAEFLDAKLVAAARQQRIVVLESSGVYVGLQVDRVFGIRHLRVDSFSEDVSNIPEILSPYVEGSFSQDGEQWLLMRPPKLMGDPLFMDVAA